MAVLNEALAARVAEWRDAGFEVMMSAKRGDSVEGQGGLKAKALEALAAQNPERLAYRRVFADAEIDPRDVAKVERDVLVVALGKNLAADGRLADCSRRSPVKKLRVVELRTDPKYGGSFEHRQASSRVELSVMVDTSYEGQTFEITLADIPERKAGLMVGAYDFDLPADSTAVAARITDMLGEEVLSVLPIDPDA